MMQQAAHFANKKMKTPFMRWKWAGRGRPKRERKRMEKENIWIPCSEQLPEFEKDVLATVKYYDGSTEVICAHRCTIYRPENTYWEDWAQEYTFENEDVTAWMPLPKPYVIKEDNSKN